MGIVQAVTRFFVCELSLADILFLARHAQNVIKHATYRKKKRKFLKKECISMVEKLKSDSDNEAVVEECVKKL